MGAMGGVWLRDRHQLFARHHTLPFSVRCFSRSSTRIYHHPLSSTDSAINVTLAMRILTGKLIRRCRDSIRREVLPESRNRRRKFGGPGRDRTDDLFHAMEARSQLRHRPTWYFYDLNSYLLGARSQTSNAASCETCKNEYPETENLQNDIQVCDRPWLLAVVHTDEQCAGARPSGSGPAGFRLLNQ